MTIRMPLNEGRIPPECEIRGDDGDIIGWRNVHVELFGGYSTRKAGAAPWPAGGGRQSTNWRISRPPHPFEIRKWTLA